jgi:hypothetical protein
MRYATPFLVCLLALVGGCGPPPLATPKVINPPDGTVFTHSPRSVTLQWTLVDGAADYTIEVDYYTKGTTLPPDGGKPEDWYSHGGRTYKRAINQVVPPYTFEFIGDQPGRWRVWAVAPDGRKSEPSPWATFRFAPPAAAGPVPPAGAPAATGQPAAAGMPVPTGGAVPR